MSRRRDTSRYSAHVRVHDPRFRIIRAKKKKALSSRVLFSSSDACPSPPAVGFSFVFTILARPDKRFPKLSTTERTKTAVQMHCRPNRRRPIGFRKYIPFRCENPCTRSRLPSRPERACGPERLFIRQSSNELHKSKTFKGWFFFCLLNFLGVDLSTDEQRKRTTK